MKKNDLTVISEIVNAADEGLSSADIYAALKKRMQDEAGSHRSFLRKLASLVDEGKIIRTGRGRAVQYRKPASAPAVSATPDVAPYIPVSDESKEIMDYVRRPVQGRVPVGYQREYPESYEPNRTYYLPADIRTHLHNIGQLGDRGQVVGGTYPTYLVNRLLIDLSWASSRLEGNTYSLLDTQNLIEAGQVSQGKDLAEATMILNHKRAIEMLIEAARDIDFNMYTFLNLHGILSVNLLGNPNDSGRLRDKIVEIGGSVYMPLGIPQQVEQYFRLILDKAREIGDPFEQSFFVMVHIPYLQPFTDVNKRVSRLGTNIPLIKNRLCPLSFIDVPEKFYIEGTLGVYELNQISLLRDVFVWAYERSCQRYNLSKDYAAEPDPFLHKYRQMLDSVIGRIVRNQLASTAQSIAGMTEGRIPDEDADKFITMVDDELQNLHEGKLSRYRIRLPEFIESKQLQSASHPDGTSSRPPGPPTGG